MHVVIVGAGPAGLLCAINLLRRNTPNTRPVYTVELVESGEDYGLVNADGLPKKRSCISMSGLAITAPLALYLHDHFTNSAHLTRHYGYRLNFVDAEQRRVQVCAADGTETYLSYDVLVGADGVRSGIHAALIRHDDDAECSVKDIFERFKAIHIDAPEGVDLNFMHVFPNCLRNMNGIMVPEPGNRIGITIGDRCDQPCDEALRSSDPSVVAQYLREHFRPFPVPCEEFSKAWVKHEWQTPTLTCGNFFHCEKLQLVITGDADEAAALGALLDTHESMLLTHHSSSPQVNADPARADIADLIQSCDTARSVRATLRQVGRTVANKILPSIVHPPTVRMKLSEMHAELHRTGKVAAVRAKISAMKQRHFEVASSSRALNCWF